MPGEGLQQPEGVVVEAIHLRDEKRGTSFMKLLYSTAVPFADSLTVSGWFLIGISFWNSNNLLTNREGVRILVLHSKASSFACRWPAVRALHATTWGALASLGPDVMSYHPMPNTG